MAQEYVVWTPLDIRLQRLAKEITGQLELNNNAGLDREKFHEIANGTDALVTLHDVEMYRPIYINDPCKTFYGFDNNWFQGMDYVYYLQTVHPSTFFSLFESVQFFHERRQGHLHLTYRLKHHSGTWQIVYGSTKTIHCYPSGKPKYGLTVMLAQEALQTIEPKDKDEEMRISMEGLSYKEKECLKLLAQDMSNKQIASTLHLSEHTIQSYRKRLIQKLNTNSSLGLVKYGLWLIEKE